MQNINENNIKKHLHYYCYYCCPGLSFIFNINYFIFFMKNEITTPLVCVFKVKFGGGAASLIKVTHTQRLRIKKSQIIIFTILHIVAHIRTIGCKLAGTMISRFLAFAALQVKAANALITLSKQPLFSIVHSGVVAPCVQYNNIYNNVKKRII